MTKVAEEMNNDEIIHTPDNDEYIVPSHSDNSISVEVDFVDWDAPENIKPTLQQKFSFVLTSEYAVTDNRNRIEELISNMLSDETGYCHYGYTYELK